MNDWPETPVPSHPIETLWLGTLLVGLSSSGRLVRRFGLGRAIRSSEIFILPQENVGGVRINDRDVNFRNFLWLIGRFRQE